MKTRYVEQLIRDVPLVREWCEGLVEGLARRKAGQGVLSLAGSGRPGFLRNPVLDAVIVLDSLRAYQYARRFVRYFDELPSRVRAFLYWRYWAQRPVSVDEAARRAGITPRQATAWLDKIHKEVAELFPRHPLN